MSELAQRKLLISKGWIQAVAIVMLCGFLILGILAYRTYTDEPPIPWQVVDPSGQVLFTEADVIAGQEVFLRNGLMEYGSIFGHGAYLGPDFTADYLHRAALIVTEHYAGSSPEAAKQQTDSRFQDQSLRQPYGGAHVYGGTGGSIREARSLLRRILWKPDDEIWIAALGDHGRSPDQTTDGVLQLVGLGGFDLAPESRVLLYEQLAS